MASKNSEPPCQTEACSLQSCLNKNTYSPERCDEHLKNLYLCCQKMYDDDSDGRTESTACPMPDVVKRWIKDHST
ncbi:hypothetical protein Moror_16852 [Moniliophthora roreri MCA 2997]|uniref:Cx9C motif-containing protein 4, mitochondrial n=1 Tax=Moniliophthora roreri (strain MCA 2997) TaxID=1381753 RepID=V2XA96_MONRO|nr:hypothetical protein Moror_16852 [Moniliophthora roreri MCA 2997]